MAAKLKRLSQGLRTVVAVALLTVTAYAAAVEMRGDHPDTYVVKRGDTLWDISGRFLQKPWLWPELWQANPQIQNPHLIYPGDVLSLAYLNDGSARLRNNGGPQVRREQLDDAIRPIPLGELKNFLENARLIDTATFKTAPHVVAIE